MKQGDSYSGLTPIKAGVPQGSVLGPTLYLLYTSDLPVPENDTIATFADDTAVLAVGETNEEATSKAQEAIKKIEKWTRTWRIKLNESKSTHVVFTNRHYVYIVNKIKQQRSSVCK